MTDETRNVPSARTARTTTPPTLRALLPAVLGGLVPCPEHDVALAEAERREETRALALRRHDAPRLLRCAGVWRHDQQATLAHFTPEVQADARAFLATWNRRHGLVINGPTGVGKTWLAVALLAELLVERNVQGCEFHMARALFSGLWQAMRQDREREHLAHLARVPVLVLDDLGQEKPSEAVVAALHELLSWRAQEYRPTILTTNLPLAQVESVYSPAIASRLSAWDQLTLGGSDRRRA